jgi:hypothetical protein
MDTPDVYGRSTLEWPPPVYGPASAKIGGR